MSALCSKDLQVGNILSTQRRHKRPQVALILLCSQDFLRVTENKPHGVQDLKGLGTSKEHSLGQDGMGMPDRQAQSSGLF